MMERNNGFYLIDGDDKDMGHILYEEKEPGVLDVTSTFVDPALRGQKKADELLDQLADKARKENLRLRPICSFVVKRFTETTRYDDIKVD